MRSKIPKATIRIMAVGLLVFLLALVRMAESQLFYDPLLAYFRGEYQNNPLPEINNLKMFFNLLLRFAINSGLSLAIIAVIFRDRNLTRFALWLYIIFFVVLITAFFALVYIPDRPNVLYLFYVRRFIIQPIFLLLFVPAFFYQKKYPTA